MEGIDSISASISESNEKHLIAALKQGFPVLFVLTQRHGSINMPSVVSGVSLTCLVVVPAEKCFLRERRTSVLFTLNSLTGLREEKAGYGRLGSFPLLPNTVCFSQEREETLSGQFE